MKTTSGITWANGCAAMALVFVGACASTTTQQGPGEYMDDAALTTKVKAELIGDPVTKARKIDVETFRGVVQLSGFVDSAAEHDEAAKVAAAVHGVKDVRNNLEIKTAESTAGQSLDDTIVTGKVKTALISSSLTKARQINVTTSNGVVQLSGFVDSQDEKMAAAEVALAVGGVRDVQNELDIKQSP